MTKYVLFYEPAADLMAKVAMHFPAHRAHWEAFRQDGTLLLIGPFANREEGAMAVFTTQAAAEAFAKGDPFVRHGVVGRWFIRQWNEAIWAP